VQTLAELVDLSSNLNMEDILSLVYLIYENKIRENYKPQWFTCLKRLFNNRKDENHRSIRDNTMPMYNTVLKKIGALD